MLLSMKPKTICAGCIARDGSTHEHMAYGVINLTIGGITAEVYTEPLARHLADFRIWHMAVPDPLRRLSAAGES